MSIRINIALTVVVLAATIFVAWLHFSPVVCVAFGGAYADVEQTSARVADWPLDCRMWLYATHLGAAFDEGLGTDSQLTKHRIAEFKAGCRTVMR